MKRPSMSCALSVLLMGVLAVSALAQITPSDDSYTLTSTPTTNYGAKTTLEVESAGATTFVRFDLSGIPSSVTGSMVAKATLKIYVSAVPTAGSFNIDLVTSPWKESTITANNTPTLGSAIASAIPLSSADKNQYVLVDVTAAAVDWLNGTENDGIAIVPDGTVSFALNSKETTSTSHPAELDIVLTGPPGPPGPITGVTAGAGLTGGGTKGNVTLSLLTSCTSGQVLQWNGSTWVCATAQGTGTITGVTAGTDLTGGGTSGNVTLNLDTTKIPQLGSNNSFTGTQQFSGNIGVGAAPSANTYTPLSIGGGNGFGTWLTLGNSSSGGHTWNILSAGSGNSEGAGNLGITDFTGTSKIFLEGNTYVSSLTATGPVNGAVVNASSSFQLGGTNFAFGSLGLANVFLGFSGNFTTTGSLNTANGYGALSSNTTGYFNTAAGTYALPLNTTGYYNTAAGTYALYSNTTGINNTAIGAYALFANTGNQNTATGETALYANTTGFQNTASGVSALISNTTGYQNTASGMGALISNTTGLNNTASGAGALGANTTGSNNTALGISAGNATNGAGTTGSNNTFVGSNANPGPNVSLTNATAIGANAEVTANNALVLGSINGLNGATANTLVGIGTTAPTQSLEVDHGDILARGKNNFQVNGDTANLFVGDTNNFIQSTYGTGITIGVFDQPTAVRINQYSGFVGIGTIAPDNLLTVNGTADKPGGGSWGTFSDARLKTLDGNFNSGLSQLLQLHPIRYRYKEENAMGIRDRDEHVGFVAQDVQRVIPEAVTENSRGYLLVNNDPILWTMLNAIKEQQREIAALRAQLGMHPPSTSKPAAGETASDNAKDLEIRTVRRQLNQLRNKDFHLEARLARLERALDDLGVPANTLVVASSRITGKRQ